MDFPPPILKTKTTGTQPVIVLVAALLSLLFTAVLFAASIRIGLWVAGVDWFTWQECVGIGSAFVLLRLFDRLMFRPR